MRSIGIEFSSTLAKLAQEATIAFRNECRHWGFSIAAIEVLNGDMTKNDRIAEVLRDACLVVVNNETFDMARMYIT